VLAGIIVGETTVEPGIIVGASIVSVTTFEAGTIIWVQAANQIVIANSGNKRSV
jgi:hypothetical protein